MHETGVIRKLLDTALRAALDRDALLQSVSLRLGVLAGGSAEHLRAHFEEELAARNLKNIGLEIVEDPDYLGGVEIVSIDLQESTR